MHLSDEEIIAAEDQAANALAQRSRHQALNSAPRYDMSIHSSPDAQKWTEFWITNLKQMAVQKYGPACSFAQLEAMAGKLATDEGAMLGWFANAMMAMHDHVKSSAGSNDAGSKAIETFDLDSNLAELKREYFRQTILWSTAAINVGICIGYAMCYFMR